MDADLNPEQAAAAGHRRGHLLIVAGAGTGKTRTLVYRLAALLDEGVPPRDLLAITFTNKAAAELRQRLIDRAGEAARGVVCGTFHGIAARWLRALGSWIGVNRDFLIYDEVDQRSLVMSLLSSGDDCTPGALIKALSATRLNPGMSAPTWDRAAKIAAAKLPEYRALLGAAGAVDFLGLLEAAADLAGAGHLPRFHEVLVDEFQDTDALQHRLLLGLAEHGSRIVAVGDDDQSIYGWRGADISGMLDFEKNYDGAERVTLARNYRSGQFILDAADRLIANNRHRLGKSLCGVRGEGAAVEVLRCADDRSEARQVVHRLETWSDEGLPGSTQAVLTRTNAQLRGLEIALAAAGLPYRLVGGRALFDTKEVRDVTAFLRLWVQPDSDLDLLRIINRPTRGLGKKAVATIRRAAAGAPLLPFLRAQGATLPNRIRRGVEPLLELLDPPPNHVSEGIERVLYDGGYLDWVCSQDPERGEEREANLLSLLDSAELLAGPDGDLAIFLEAWSLAGGADLGRGEGVRLMTLHASKGLEFATVILPGFEEGLMPMPDPEGSRFDHIEEERRLAYVGLTRARDKVLITWATSRLHHGRALPGRPSRFIAELAGDGVIGYAHHPIDGLRRAPLVTAPATQQWVPASDEFAQPDYGDEEPGVFAMGSQVTHSSFGAGVVQAIRGIGSSANIEVRFRDGSKRTIRASYLSPTQEP